MKPTQVLSEEHRVIEVMLDCLERLTEQALEAGALDEEAARQAVDFIRNFADKCHHGKEEGKLFPALVAKGLPENSGPVAVMLREHEQGRTFVRGMNENIAAAAHGDRRALESFAEHARGYINLLRAHIQKEDGVLFPLADEILTEAEQQSLLNNFDVIESEHMGAGTHEKYLNIVRDLTKKYGVPLTDMPKNSCGCHHQKTTESTRN